jgi:hypothetical protein
MTLLSNETLKQTSAKVVEVIMVDRLVRSADNQHLIAGERLLAA